MEDRRPSVRTTEKPWETMYRSLLYRLEEIVENGEPMDAVELMTTVHIKVMSEYDGVPTHEWRKYRGWRDG